MRANCVLRQALCRLLGYCLLLALGSGNLPAADECRPEQARAAASNLSCVQPVQLEAVLGYQNPAGDEHMLREALAAAAGVASCINNVEDFPDQPESRADFHCLQVTVLDFYDALESDEVHPARLHYQDLLARASLRFHYSLLATDLTIPDALKLVEDSLAGYQEVFLAAGKIRAAPSVQENLELADQLGMKPSDPAPEFHYLEEFASMASTNARRYPRALGRQLGTALGPVLCEAYQLYPQHQARIAHLYNVLVRFDLGNMAAAGQLDAYLHRLRDFFRPAPGLFSFLRLEPPDWAPTAPPCGEPDWRLVFPRFELTPGFRLPETTAVESKLDELEKLLLSTAELAENRNHLWKVFHRHGQLLFKLGAALKMGAARHESLRETRHLLMQKARDTFLMRGVSPQKQPLDPGPLYAAIDEQINTYADELLSDLQLSWLVPYLETYVDAGEIFLSPSQLENLHRRLAIAYTLLDDPAQALAHRQKTNLTQAQLDRFKAQVRASGVGVKIKKPEQP